MASLDLKKDLPIKNFIDDLIEAQGWSNEKWDEWAEAWDTHCW